MIGQIVKKRRPSKFSLSFIINENKKLQMSKVQFEMVKTDLETGKTDLKTSETSTQTAKTDLETGKLPDMNFE